MFLVTLILITYTTKLYVCLLGHFEIKDTTWCMSRLQCFVRETMQRLYRLWKSCLQTHYKQCGTTRYEWLKNLPEDLWIDQWTCCVDHFSSTEFWAFAFYTFFISFVSCSFTYLNVDNLFSFLITEN